MWSILYARDGKIHQLGPFDSDGEAIKAAKEAHKEGEFDVDDIYVYILGATHCLWSLSGEDLTEEFTEIPRGT